MILILFQDPIVRVNNYIRHRLEREVEILNLINKSPDRSLSLEDIISTLYQVLLIFKLNI